MKLADNQVNHESNPALALRDKRKAAELLQKYERAHRQLEHHPSHLFVVHGTIGEVVHDAVIIPTDAYLTVEEHWRKFGDSEPLPTRADFSAGWARWGTSSAWLVDVASRDYQTVLAHLGEALHAIAEARPWHGSDERVPRGRRPLPLVVLPVLGIGSGGHGDEKGSVLSRLTQLLKDAVGKLPFDIALVTPDPAVYAAAQYTRQLNQTKHPVDEEAIKLALHK